MAIEFNKSEPVSSTVEDYLKVVLKIEDMQQKASTSKLARHLAVADPTVTDMLRKLKKIGLLEYKPYHGATLTKKGRLMALRILRRHRLLELFLHQILGYGWEEVHGEAENLEHAVSDFFVDKIDQLLNFPVKDPHGEPIPNAQGVRQIEDDIRLVDADLGQYLFRRVSSSDPEFLAYLEKVKLFPATQFSLQEKAPFQGPLKLLIRDELTPLYLGVEAAKSIHVTPLKTKERLIDGELPVRTG